MIKKLIHLGYSMGFWARNQLAESDQENEIVTDWLDNPDMEPARFSRIVIPITTEPERLYFSGPYFEEGYDGPLFKQVKPSEAVDIDWENFDTGQSTIRCKFCNKFPLFQPCPHCGGIGYA